MKKATKCKEQGCKKLSIDNNDGYCLGHICPPAIPLILQHLNDLNEKKSKNKTVDTAVEQLADR